MAATPAPVTAATPAHFFRREAIDLIARGDGGLDIGIRGQFGVIEKRSRHQRRSLRARGECHAARGKSKGELQKVSAFHDISSSIWLT